MGIYTRDCFFFYFFYCSGFCHTLKWNSHGFTCVPHPDPPSHLPLHLIPLGLPSAPGPSAWRGCLFKIQWQTQNQARTLGEWLWFYFWGSEQGFEKNQKKKKEKLSSKFKELFLRKEKSKEKNSIKCRVRGPFSLRHPISKGFPGGPSGKESACQCRRHKR